MIDTQVKDTPWNVFPPDKYYYKDDSTESYEFAKYNERNNNIIGLTEYQLTISDLDLPVLMSDAFIHARVQICTAGTEKADVPTPITTGEVALCNNGFNIFTRAQYHMNDNLVEDLNEVGVSTSVKNFIDYGKSYSESAHNELWIPDEGSSTHNSVVVYNADLSAVLTMDTNADNSIRVTRAAGEGTALANDQRVRFFLNDTDELIFKKIVPAGDESIVVPILDGLVAGPPQTALVTFAGLAQHHIYKIYAPDGTELQFKVAGLFAAYGSAADPGHVDLVNGVAAAEGQAVSISCPSYHPLYNKGFEKRRQRTLNPAGTTKLVNLFLPIRKLFKCFEFNQNIFRGVKHHIVLYKNTNYKTVLMRDRAAGAAAIQIKELSLYVPILKASQEVGIKLDSQLNSGLETILKWDQMRCYISGEYGSANGVAAESQWRITPTDRKVVRVFVVFQTINQYGSGSAQYNNYNPMTFNHMNIERCHLKLNSYLQYPKEEFQSDFGTDDWIRLYTQYLQISGKAFDYEGGGVPINYTDFKDKYPIFCFDCSKVSEGIWKNTTTIDIELKYKRSAELAPPDNVNYRIYAICEFEKEIKLQGVQNRLRVVL